MLAMLAISNFEDVTALDTWILLGCECGGVLAVGALGYYSLMASKGGRYGVVFLVLLSALLLEGGVVYTMLWKLVDVPRAVQSAVIIGSIHGAVSVPLGVFGLIWYQAMTRVSVRCFMLDWSFNHDTVHVCR